VILQHDPARTHFVDHDHAKGRVPAVEDEIQLIGMFDVDVLGISLNEFSWKGKKMDTYQSDLQSRLKIPVIRPLSEGVERIVDVIEALTDA
jgi:uncharacterized NAD-dependent epimerase/dehydratase family protein